MSFDLVNRKGAKKRHLLREEDKTGYGSGLRYKATAMCGAKFGGEYHRSRGEARDVGCSECLVAAIRMPDRHLLDLADKVAHR